MHTLESVAVTMLPEAERIVATYKDLEDPWEIISEASIRLRKSTSRGQIQNEEHYVKRVLWNTAKTMVSRSNRQKISVADEILDSCGSEVVENDSDLKERIYESLSSDGRFALQALLGMADKKQVFNSRLLSDSAAQKRYERGVHEVRVVACRILEQEYGRDRLESILRNTRFALSYLRSRNKELLDRQQE
jgi:hypothetical protein